MANTNPPSDLSTDYSADHSNNNTSSSSREWVHEDDQDDDDVDATTQILNTACESSPSEASSDELLLPTCRHKTDSQPQPQPQHRPFEFDLSVARNRVHGTRDDEDTEDNST